MLTDAWRAPPSSLPTWLPPRRRGGRRRSASLSWVTQQRPRPSGSRSPSTWPGEDGCVIAREEAGLIGVLRGGHRRGRVVLRRTLTFGVRHGIFGVVVGSARGLAVAAAAVDGDAVDVDLREPAELSGGMIAGAVHAPRGMLEFYADPTSPYHRPEFDPARRTILYCASGGRSALAARSLAELGYGDVGHLDGGFKAWVASGGPIGHGES